MMMKPNQMASYLGSAPSGIVKNIDGWKKKKITFDKKKREFFVFNDFLQTTSQYRCERMTISIFFFMCEKKAHRVGRSGHNGVLIFFFLPFLKMRARKIAGFFFPSSCGLVGSLA